jgi:hypothetical protein
MYVCTSINRRDQTILPTNRKTFAYQEEREGDGDWGFSAEAKAKQCD